MLTCSFVASGTNFKFNFCIFSALDPSDLQYAYVCSGMCRVLFVLCVHGHVLFNILI